ncbi:enoyl-CoA hydratase/isomerase family protein [Nocardioides daejeonensis]|uniref:enoyl-CoA hydratase/isomerase family protein n=1 Tax=Nocardioides daejeonensis TaxID=1046556 RepID=UPI000D7423E3|nr:enoyl-CoA hydratase/isomerase family protein [Nocardioides daejeonensis]
MTLVNYSVADGVAHIEINRPDVSNAFDVPTSHAFDEAIGRAEADDEVRAVLLTGAGKRFSAGGDVAAMVAADDPSGFLLELAEALDVAARRLDALAKPVVCAVQGAVAGAGNSVMLAADVIVAAESTKFVMAYPGVGLTPDIGVSWLLPRAVGQVRALEYALTGRTLSAAEARDWGLVTTVVADEEVQTAARELAVRIAAGPVFALGQARRLIRDSWDRTREESGAVESRTIAEAVRTADAQQRLAAFTKK